MASVLNAGHGIRTFRILCKQAKHCGDNDDVASIVRDFLIVSISQMSDLYWRFMPELPTCSPFRARIHAAVCWVDSATLVNRNFEPGEEDLLRDRLEEEGLEYLNDAHERQLADASEHNPEKENTTAVSVIIDIVNIAWLRAMECTVKWDSLETPKYFSLLTDFGNEKRFDIIQILDGARANFDNRPSGNTTTRMVEVPTTLDEWTDFFNLRLFGPTPIKQVTIH